MYFCKNKNSLEQEGVFEHCSILNKQLKLVIMSFKSTQLFANSQMKKRKTPEQEDFETEHKELLVYSANAINQALIMMHKERETYPISFRGRNWAATTINGFVNGLISKKYPDKMKQDFGAYSYCGSSAILKFKKLSDKLIPENIKTEKVERERNQLSFQFETNIPIVYIGYTLDSTMDQITGCYAVCLDNWDRKIWVSDLSELTISSVFSNVENTNPINNQAGASLVKLKEVGRKKAE